MTHNGDVLTALGRIEENLRHVGENAKKADDSNLRFQMSAQETFTAHAEKLGNHSTSIVSLGNRVKVIEDSMKASFTKSTVIIGLIFTALNVVFGFLGR